MLDEFFDLCDPFHILYKKNSELWSPLLGIKDFFDEKLLGTIEIDIPEGVFLENKHLISIGKGTVIEPGTFIKGPCIIGKNCEIRFGAYIRGNVWIGNNCLVGHCTEIKNSLLFNGAKAAHFVYVGDTILGRDVNLGAGVKCANFRLDKQPISLRINGKKIITGLKKMGAILGDGVQVGCNSVLSPGTLLAIGTTCYPCMHINGYYSKNTCIRTQDKTCSL